MTTGTPLNLNAAPSTAVSAELHPLLQRLRSGDVRALARAISLVENAAPEAMALLAACYPFTGDALRIGFTGSPGAGKSTLVDQLARHLRAAEQTVGIVAVDPTSPYTGGAILGDRIRMNDHYADPGIYIRSMATRGFLGGLAKTTADVCTVLEASGKQKILIETVGVGQDEVDIVRLADITMVILVPGMGDDVQSLKAGIMEIADIFVINKSDREGADRVEREIRAMQSLALRHEARVPAVVRTVATTGEGLAELQQEIARCEEYLHESGLLRQKRQAAWRERLVEMLRQEMLRQLLARGLNETELQAHAAAIAAHTENPYTLVPQLLTSLLAAQAQ
ncbi:MAG: methylmalonyl Co-A mutase-associated GTPase MeaB [Acidobacteriaceae bacterium]